MRTIPAIAALATVATRLTEKGFRVFVRRMHRVAPAVALLTWIVVLSRDASAEATCTSNASTSSEPIASELASEANRARTWRYAWTGINAGSMVLSLAGIPILSKSERPALIVGAATSAVSGGFTWFWPLDVEKDAELAQRVGCQLSADRPLELARLRQHSGRDEAERLRWPWHVGNVVTALIPGAILWFGFNRRLDGTLATLGSIASGEIELLTQPSRLVGYASLPVSVGFRTMEADRGLTIAYTVLW